MSKRSLAEANAGGSSHIRLETVNTLWLEAGTEERYLLLEDPETKDVLMPLIYMKHVLEANYSRKLASLKHRLVTAPPTGPLANHAGLLYWQWAFESPHAIKLIVRNEIGEATPQGHLRLVLVPIVYNALAGRADLRATALFRALHRAVRVSTYWPLVRPLPDGVLAEADAAAGIPPGATVAPLFQGPKMLETTAMKYMFMFKDQDEMEASKRNRTTGASTVDNGLLTAAIVGSGTLAQPTDLVELLRKSSSAAGLAQQGSIAAEGEERRGLGTGVVAGSTLTAAAPHSAFADGLAAVADAAAAAALGLTSPGGPLGAPSAGAADDDAGADEDTDSPMATDAAAEAPSARRPTPAAPAPAPVPGTVDPGTADAVRQLVDLKFQEVVRELNRLKSGMVQLYQGVTSMMTAQAPPVAGIPPPPLPAGPAAMGWGQGLASMVGKQSGGMPSATALASQELINRMYQAGASDGSGSGGLQKLVRSRMGPPDAPSAHHAPSQQPVPSWPPLQDAIAAAGLPPLGSNPESSLGQLAALLGNSQEGDLMVAALARSGDYFPPLASALLNAPGEGGKLLSAFSLRDIQDQSQSAPETGNAAAAAMAAAVAATAPGAAAPPPPVLGARTAAPMVAPAATVNPSATDGKLVAPDAATTGIDHFNEGAGSGNGQPSPVDRVAADAQATVAWAHTVGAALPQPAPASQQ